MRVGLRFYRTDWKDFWSVLSHFAHWIKLGRRPVYTHVSLLVGMQEFFLTNKGVVTVNGTYYSKQEYYDYTFIYTKFNIDMIENVIAVYALTKLEINWADAINFLFPKRHSNNCITFCLAVLGYPVRNIAADELFRYVIKQDRESYPPETTTVFPHECSIEKYGYSQDYELF